MSGPTAAAAGSDPKADCLGVGPSSTTQQQHTMTLNKLLILFEFQFSLLLHGDKTKLCLPPRVPMYKKEAHICQVLGSAPGLEFGRPQDLQCDQYWVGLGGSRVG